MNKPVTATSLQASDRLRTHSPDIDALLSRIAERASDLICGKKPLQRSDAKVWIHPQWQAAQR